MNRFTPASENTTDGTDALKRRRRLENFLKVKLQNGEARLKILQRHDSQEIVDFTFNMYEVRC